MKKIGLLALGTLLFVLTVSYLLFGDGETQSQALLRRKTRALLRPGDSMPSITLHDPRGVLRSSDALRGQYVLVDFWASWCQACRRQSPELLCLYDRFHQASFKGAKGFALFSISLDGLKTPNGKPAQIEPAMEWKQAIRADDLHWPDQVSALQGWDSPWAQKLGVRQLPYNFLVSPQGVILGVNLSLSQVRETLERARTEAQTAPTPPNR